MSGRVDVLTARLVGQESAPSGFDYLIVLSDTSYKHSSVRNKLERMGCRPNLRLLVSSCSTEKDVRKIYQSSHKMWRFLPGVSNPGAETPPKSAKRDRDEEYEKNKRRRLYRKEWEAEHQWLAYDEEEEVMFCKICRASNVPGATGGKKQNSFYKGSNTFKVETIKKHSASENHRLAVDRERARRAAPGTSQAEKMLKGMNVAAVNRLKLLFRNAHAVARNCRPYTDYRWMTELDSAKGLDVGSAYRTDKSARKFVHFIAEV